ncbi:MAG: hypothetical protein IT423_10355 [Pirellulaceae bacterium]|nr:hypothetical protein [Pirellulaceae bacterium]
MLLFSAAISSSAHSHEPGKGLMVESALGPVVKGLLPSSVPVFALDLPSTECELGGRLAQDSCIEHCRSVWVYKRNRNRPTIDRLQSQGLSLVCLERLPENHSDAQRLRQMRMIHQQLVGMFPEHTAALNSALERIRKQLTLRQDRAELLLH